MNKPTRMADITLEKLENKFDRLCDSIEMVLQWHALAQSDRWPLPNMQHLKELGYGAPVISYRGVWRPKKKIWEDTIKAPFAISILTPYGTVTCAACKATEVGAIQRPDDEDEFEVDAWRQPITILEMPAECSQFLAENGFPNIAVGTVPSLKAFDFIFGSTHLRGYAYSIPPNIGTRMEDKMIKDGLRARPVLSDEEQREILKKYGYPENDASGWWVCYDASRTYNMRRKLVYTITFDDYMRKAREANVDSPLNVGFSYGQWALLRIKSGGKWVDDNTKFRCPFLENEEKRKKKEAKWAEMQAKEKQKKEKLKKTGVPLK